MLDWFFPKKCLGCQKPGKYLCFSCQKKIYQLRAQICPVCQRTSLEGKTHFGCQRRTLFLNGLISLYSYQFPLNKLLKQFKYYQVRELENLISDLGLKALKDRKILDFWRKREFVFLPLPLFPARKLWRGFNQSEIILKKICQKLDLNFDPEILIRKKWTKDQAKLNPKQRRENIKQAFEVKKDVKNKNLVVFDDIWTTGGTIKEAAKTLKQGQANQIWGLTLCR